MSGPHEQRLRAMLHGASKQAIQAAYQEWRAGSELLLAVSTTLHRAAPRIEDQFGRTGSAAARAFGTVAGKVAGRSEQMSAAGQALVAALDAIAQAESLRDSFDAAPLSEPARPTPTPGPSTPEDVAARKQYDSRKASYDAAYADREARAAAAADRMDTVFAESTGTMKQIHGDPDPVQRQPAGGPGGTGSTGGASPSSTGTATSSGGYRPPSGGYQTHTTPTAHPGEPPTSTTTTTTPHAPPTSTPHDVPSETTPLPPGTAQGGNEPWPTGSSTPGGSVPGGGIPAGGLPTGGGSSTGLTAPTAGGLAGISGAVRGPSVVPPGQRCRRTRHCRRPGRAQQEGPPEVGHGLLRGGAGLGRRRGRRSRRHRLSSQRSHAPPGAGRPGR